MKSHLRIHLAELREFIGCPHAYYLSRSRKMSAANRFTIYSNACRRVLQVYFLEKINNFQPFDEKRFLMANFGAALYGRQILKFDDSELDYMKGMFALFVNVIVDFFKDKHIAYPAETLQHHMQWPDEQELTVYCDPLAAVTGPLTGGPLTGLDFILIDPTGTKWNHIIDKNNVLPGFFRTIAETSGLINHMKNNLYVVDTYTSSIRTVKLKGKKILNWKGWIKKAGRNIVDRVWYPTHYQGACQRCKHSKYCTYFSH